MKKHLAIAIAAMVAGGVVPAMAEVYELSPVVVTATRTQKQEVNVPMSTEVISGKELAQRGGSNLQTSLAMVSGVNFKQFGPGGGHMGTMQTEVAMRGIKNGTLVLVNGNPINARGKYYLDAIPTERIERVEIIKGGGSVLYGSEAMAGVINIITKDGGNNSVSLGVGSHGQHTFDFEIGDNRFSLAAHREKWGLVKHVSDLDDYRYANAPKTLKNSYHAGYRFNDKLSFSYDYNRSLSRYTYYFAKVKKGADAKVGDVQQYRDYITRQNLAQLNYVDGNFEARAYFNQVGISADGYNYFKSKTHKVQNTVYSTEEMNRTYGLDVQNTWNLSDRTDLLFGATYQHEYYDKYAKKKGGDLSRNNYAVYTQVEHRFDARNTLILSGRETWTGGAPRGQNYDDFSAAGQYIHHLNKDENLYVNISQSFLMPTFAQMYGASESAVENPDLKPQKGINYEVGYKKVHNKHMYKLALYHAEIKDNIKVSSVKDSSGSLDYYEYINSKFRNTGIEAEMSYQSDNHWSYHLGVNIQNPKSKDEGPKAKKPYWDREYGRLQISGGVTYHQGPWLSTLTFNYLGRRVGSPSAYHSEPISPYLLTTWNTTYTFDDQNMLSLRIDNVLDREDNLSNSGSFYRSTPFNCLLTYQHKF